MAKAACDGNAVAQRLIGNCYIEGVAVAKDVGEAVKWYRKAAEQGDAEAQYLLGICYLKGNGIKSDKRESLKWLRRSANRGDENAIEALRKLDSENSIGK